VRTGVDVARAIALGAKIAGIARPVLQALRKGGEAGAEAYLDRVERELRTVLLLTGCRTLSQLERAPRVSSAASFGSGSRCRPEAPAETF
jgi:isopentenyl-diphosphate delta-isomerase